jgi:D-alanyl-D-alanine carboxypeptidase
MSRVRLAFWLPIALFLGLAPIRAMADPVDDFVREQMATFKLPGLALAVVKDGRAIKTAGYGVADKARQTPVTPQTVFKIGSVSKQFIASGVMLLVADGKLSLDDPASKYLQGTPPAWRGVTIRQLLSHTAGLGREPPGFDPLRQVPDAEVVRSTYDLPLSSAPGTAYDYSNTGYWALAEIIRVVSGKPWGDFIQERIFRPAGLGTTAPTNVELALRALGYTGNDNLEPAPPWVAVRPSGAFLSTVEDLARWEAVLRSDTVLNEATRRLMWTPTPLSGGGAAPYGFGWHVDAGDAGRKRIWHGGGLPGFSAYYLRYPDEGLAVIVLTNGDDGDPAGIANSIASRFFLRGQGG